MLTDTFLTQIAPIGVLALQITNMPNEKTALAIAPRRFISLRVLGLEPKTHGLKGRCSTN